MVHGLVRLAALAWLVLCFFAIAGINFAEANSLACRALLATNIRHLMITTAEFIPEGTLRDIPTESSYWVGKVPPMLPSHCLVQGELEGRTGVAGQHFGLRFELRLPEQWQGRFLFQGGGGLDGFIDPAVGNIPVRETTAPPALSRGYAVVSTDSGHQGRDAAFASDQQARLDYAYAAIGKISFVAKELVHRYYKRDADYSYFMGCSNGGREAMIAAQRYPLEFDGVVVGDPSFHRSRATVGMLWDIQTLAKIAPIDASGLPLMSQAFSKDDLDLVRMGVVASCDTQDGLADGIVNNFQSCQFQPRVLQCGDAKQAHCLTPEKVVALETLFNGAKNSQGESLYSGWFYDTGIASEGWRRWKLGFTQQAGLPDSINMTAGVDALQGYYLTPPDRRFTPFDFSFDQDVSRLDQTAALNDATSTFLTTFAQRGGKMLLFHGLSDPAFSAVDLIAWYQKTGKDSRMAGYESLSEWAKLFIIPGMTHCGGGRSFSDFDPLAAIEGWVERQQEPASLPARSRTIHGMRQPLCPYPQYAYYRGGSVDQLTSFQCKGE